MLMHCKNFEVFRQMISDRFNLYSNLALPPLAKSSRHQSNEWTPFGENSIRWFATTARRAFLVFCVLAIAGLCMIFFKPHLADKLKAMSPFAKPSNAEFITTAAPTLESPLVMPDIHTAVATSAAPVPRSDYEERDGDATRQQQRVAIWLSKHYRIASSAVSMMVSATYLAAREAELDPLLILAVMSVESRFNPFSESALGAQGLMQVRSKNHLDKFKGIGGANEVLNPVANIKIGSKILKEDVIRGGSIESGLKLYVGAAAFDKNTRHDLKILAEYHRLKHIATGKNGSVYDAPMAASPRNRVL
jgi:hypothetical protein